MKITNRRRESWWAIFVLYGNQGQYQTSRLVGINEKPGVEVSIYLGLEADRSRLPRRLVVVVQLDYRRLNLVAERLRLVVSDG